MASKEIVILIKARNDAGRTLKQIKTQLGGIAGLKFTGLLGGLAQIGRVAKIAAIGGVASLVGGLALLAKTSVETAAEFEQGMANAAAIMERPIHSMGEFKALAMDLAIDPRFRVTALEATSAIEMLARNGVDATDILDGMLMSTVALSNSVGTDLATAADVMTDAMNIFGLEASEAMTAVDQMTGVVNSSKFTIDDYFLALGRAGASLAPLGGSFDDFNATLSLIAPFFNSGQRAGTSLANFFNRLIPTTNKARDAMLRLGMASTDENGEGFFNNFINRDPDAGPIGQIKNMTEVIELLQDSLGNLTAEAQQKAILEIFGRDAQGAVAALVQFGDTFETVQESVMSTDALTAAATRMQTLQGATDVLKGFFESLRIVIGSAFLPVLTFLAVRLQGVVGTIIDKVNPALVKFKEISEAVFDTIGDSALTLDTLKEVFKEYVETLSLGGLDTDNLRVYNEQMGKLDTLLNGGLGLKDTVKLFAELFLDNEIATGISKFIRFIESVKGAFDEWMKSEAAGKVIEFLKFLALRLGFLAGLTGLVSLLSGIGAVIVALASPLGILATVLAVLTQAWINNWGDIQGKTQKVVDFIVGKFNLLMVWWDNNGPRIMFFIQGFGQTIKRAWESDIKPALTALGDAFKLFLGGDTQGAVKKLGEAFSGMLKGGDKIAAGLGRLLRNVWDMTLGPLWETTIAPKIASWWDGIIASATEFVTSGKLGAVFANFSPMAILGDVIQSLFDMSGLAEQDPVAMAQGFIDFLANGFTGADKTGAATSLWDGIVTAWTDVIEPNIGSFVMVWLNKIASWDFIPWAATFTLALVDAIISKFTEAVLGKSTEELWGPWDTVFMNIINGESVTTIGKSILDAMLNGVVQNISIVAEKFGAFWTAINTWVAEADWFTIGETLGLGLFKGLKWTLFLGPTLIALLVEFIDALSAWFVEQDWKKIGTDAMTKLLDGLRWVFLDGPNLWEMLNLAATAIKNWFSSEDRPWNKSGTEVGESIATGMITGLNNMWNAVIGAVSGLASGVVSALKTVLGISSPSKVTMELGLETGRGFSQGIAQAEGMVNAATVGMAGAVTAPLGPMGITSPLADSGSHGQAALLVKHELEIKEDTLNLSDLIDKIVREVVASELSIRGRRVDTSSRTGLR